MLVMISAEGRPLLRADTRELQAAGSGRGRGGAREGAWRRFLSHKLGASKHT